MKRSKANKIIQYTIDALKKAQFPLPPFAYYTTEDWKNLDETEVELVENMPVWEAQTITKNATSGDFAQWTDFSFGEPGVCVLPDGSLFVVLWYQQGGVNGVRYVHLTRE